VRYRSKTVSILVIAIEVVECRRQLGSTVNFACHSNARLLSCRSGQVHCYFLFSFKECN